MNKLKKIALIALISAAMTGNAFAQGHTSKADNQQQTEQQSKQHQGKHHRKHNGKKKRHQRAKKSNMGSVLRYYRHADINKEQRKKIKQIFKDARMEIKPHRQKMMKTNAELKTIRRVESYDNQAAAKAIETITSSQKITLEIMNKAKHQVWTVLTPEQQKKLNAFDQTKKAKKQKQRQRKRQKQKN